jgi:hypothetical protein
MIFNVTLALAPKALSWQRGHGPGTMTAGTANGGGCFRLVVSRFNELQRRCSLHQH